MDGRDTATNEKDKGYGWVIESAMALLTGCTSPCSAHDQVLIDTPSAQNRGGRG